MTESRTVYLTDFQDFRLVSEAECYVERARWKQRGRDRERCSRAAVDASGPTGEVESRWVRTSRWGLIGDRVCPPDETESRWRL